MLFQEDKITISCKPSKANIGSAISVFDNKSAKWQDQARTGERILVGFDLRGHCIAQNSLHYGVTCWELARIKRTFRLANLSTDLHQQCYTEEDLLEIETNGFLPSDREEFYVVGLSTDSKFIVSSLLTNNFQVTDKVYVEQL
jgi:hypothetical protein